MIHWKSSNIDIPLMSIWIHGVLKHLMQKYEVVVDYPHFHMIYHQRGIYLDSNVDVARYFEEVLSDWAFIGFITKVRIIEAETIGCEQDMRCSGNCNNVMVEDMSYEEGTKYLKKHTLCTMLQGVGVMLPINYTSGWRNDIVTISGL